jgi:hypothetical protein
MVEPGQISEETRMTTAFRSAPVAPAALFVGLIACVALLWTPAARAAIEPEFTHFSMTPSTTQAGGHPDLEISVSWSLNQGECPQDCLWFSTFTAHAPAGLIGNPHAAPRCTLTELATARCPVDSQVGIVNAETIFLPLYNMETRPDQAGLLAFTAPGIQAPLFVELTGRTDSDYGLDSSSTPLIRGAGIASTEVVFWGVPANPAHDVHRFISPLSFVGGCFDLENGCPGTTFAKATVPEAPFLSNPTTCGVPLTARADGEYYGGARVHAEAPYPATTGCSQLSFNPSIAVKPTTGQGDAPSGLDLDLKVPQTVSPDTPSPSELRAAKVTLPEGFTFNTGAADGKVACLDEQTSIGTLFAATCPEFAKIGTLELDVAALPAPIPGALYIGEPKPGNRYRVVLTADGFATHVKLLGSAYPDPQTGRVTFSFEELPQSPLQEFSLHIFGSERGLFATPEQCGTYPVEAEFVPWDSSLTTRQVTAFMDVTSGPNGSPCPDGSRPFAPGLEGGVANNSAGRHAPLSLRLTRKDGDQSLTGLTLSTPPGFSATLRGVPYCPQSAIDRLADTSYSGIAEQASPACPPASQIGTATTGAGAGTHPVYVAGKLYLAGPYKGAPLSLVAVIPAVSGPYDLGNVSVRVAVFVDPVTGQVTTVSDPLPQIIGGIPLRTRLVRISLDRPDFALNPTNCDPFAIKATIMGDEGGVASPEQPFQVANCDKLSYGPKLALKLSGGLRRRGHPALHAVLTTGPGEANTRNIAVTLPKGELLDNAHIGTVCTRPDFVAGKCPSGSVLGHAEVASPLLDQPLEGTAYLRSSSNRLPDLVIDLKGQVDFAAAARIDSVKGRLRATFDTVPDVPLGRVTLDLMGGKRGILTNSEALCGVRKSATVRMSGQNGAVLNTTTRVQAPCGSPPRHKRHHRSRKAVR